MSASEHDLPATLRAKGYRLTPQRQLVLDAVTLLEHATPDEIGSQVQRSAPGVNLSTVYRTLELLEELGLVTHTHLGHGAPTYHPASTADHLHLVCRDCGAVTETAKDYNAGHRLYGLVAGELLWAYDMAAMGQELQPHLWGKLVRR